MRRNEDYHHDKHKKNFVLNSNKLKSKQEKLFNHIQVEVRAIYLVI